MPLTAVSARFFLALAVGLAASVLVVNRREIGPGFLRLMALFVVGCLIPAILLFGGIEHPQSDTIRMACFVFIGLMIAMLAGAPKFPPALITSVLLVGVIAGATGIALSLHQQLPNATAASLSWFALGGLTSSLILGFVTGAMILGHWYLVTPDLSISHLARVTRLALASLYLKIILLAITFTVFMDQMEAPWQSLGAVIGLNDAPATGFQSQLDFIFLLARIFIGLVGPAVLCHMTMQTIKLRATQPATGILYAATVMVLMGELFAFLGESSFEVVL